jgi:hypothetical protein
MWRRVDIVLTDVSEEGITSIFELEAIRSSETSVNTVSTRHHIPEDGIFKIMGSFRKQSSDHVR